MGKVLGMVPSLEKMKKVTRHFPSDHPWRRLSDGSQRLLNLVDNEYDFEGEALPVINDMVDALAEIASELDG